MKNQINSLLLLFFSLLMVSMTIRSFDVEPLLSWQYWFLGALLMICFGGGYIKGQTDAIRRFIKDVDSIINKHKD